MLAAWMTKELAYRSVILDRATGYLFAMQHIEDNNKAQLNQKTIAKFNFDESVGFLVYIANRLLVGNLSRAIAHSDIPLTTEQYRALYKIWQQDGLTQSELAAKLYQDKSSMSRLVSHLEDKGYITRNFQENSAKLYSLSITESGIECLSLCVTEAHKTLEFSVHNLEDDQINLLKDALKIIINNLSEN